MALTLVPDDVAYFEVTEDNLGLGCRQWAGPTNNSPGGVVGRVAFGASELAECWEDTYATRARQVEETSAAVRSFMSGVGNWPPLYSGSGTGRHCSTGQDPCLDSGERARGDSLRIYHMTAIDSTVDTRPLESPQPRGLLNPRQLGRRGSALLGQRLPTGAHYRLDTGELQALKHKVSTCSC